MEQFLTLPKHFREKLDGLKVTPGAYLGSCRYKLPESLEDPVYPRLFKNLKK